MHKKGFTQVCLEWLRVLRDKKSSMKGFTLAEVLITLTIIGVVAALTIPTLIQSSNSARYTTALKKNIAMLNQAMMTNISNGSDASLSTIDSSSTLAEWFIVGTVGQGGSASNIRVLQFDMATAAIASDAWLPDGTRLHFVQTAGGSGGCNAIADPTAFNVATAGNCYVVVDVNGDKTPNTAATATEGGGDLSASDVWVLGISPNAVTPVVLATTAITISGYNGVDGTSTPYASSPAIGNTNSASYSAMVEADS